jgi:hypothetical protein
MRRLVLCLAILMTLCTSSTLARVLQQPNSNTKGGGAAPLLQDVFGFWLKHGPDKEYGKHNALDLLVQFVASDAAAI